MSRLYEEILDGGPVFRKAPGARHEKICARLHEQIRASVADVASTRLLAPRTRVELPNRHAICPDLALLSAANGTLWLAVEIIDPGDHHPDTVVKKQIYEEIKLPRLWVVDPRYDNVEIYHGSPHGLALKEILACNDVLSENLLPEFQITIRELFA